MIFLNFALLGGIAALSIPVIIHFFHKSRFEVVKWGAMHLLESIVRVNQRRLRIEQLLLLLVRASIPILLALAMARPVWQGAQKLLGNAKSSMVLLLDNSYSMDAGRTGQSSYFVAREQAAQVVGGLPRGSEVQAVYMGEGGGTLLDAPTWDTARLAQLLRKSEAGYGTAIVPAALDFAATVLDQMHEPARDVVVFTDFQRISFEPAQDALVARMIERLKQMPVPPQITFFDVGEEVSDNIAVESLEFSKLTAGVGQKLQIRANLRNFGETSYPDLRVYFRVDGTEKSASQISLPAHESGQLLFTHVFETAGSHVVEVFAVADSLKADNSYLASIDVRDKVPVLLIDGAPSPEPMKGETDFAEIALQPYASGKVDLTDLISTKVIRVDELNSAALTGVAVVIMANVPKLDDEKLKSLEEYVRNGGGLLIFPGDHVDSAWYQNALFHEGAGLLPLGMGGSSGELPAGTSGAAIVGEHFENPALSLFNDSRNGSLSDASIKTWYRYEEASPKPGNEPAVILARLDSGDPFLVEKSFGQGRVIACATALDADWSNLPMRPFYLPLLQRLSVYLASTVDPPRNLGVGDAVTALLPAAMAGKKAALALPDGSSIEIPIEKKEGHAIAQYAQTQRAGIYTLTPPEGAPIYYVVNTSRKESDLRRLSTKEIAAFGLSHGVAIVHSMDEYRRVEKTRRFGTEVWKPLLWVLLVLCFLEVLLQQHFARVRAIPATAKG